MRDGCTHGPAVPGATAVARHAPRRSDAVRDGRARPNGRERRSCVLWNALERMKLMLKISRDGSATAQRTDLIVDAQEEAQVRELYSLSPRNPCVVAHPAGKSFIGTFLLVLIALVSPAHWHRS